MTRPFVPLRVRPSRCMIRHCVPLRINPTEAKWWISRDSSACDESGTLPGTSSCLVWLAAWLCAVLCCTVLCLCAAAACCSPPPSLSVCVCVQCKLWCLVGVGHQRTRRHPGRLTDLSESILTLSPPLKKKGPSIFIHYQLLRTTYATTRVFPLPPFPLRSWNLSWPPSPPHPGQLD